MQKKCSPIDERIMEALWSRLGHIYGNKFSDEFGNSIEFWFRAFQEKGLCAEDIKHGLDACLDSGDQFPPTLPKFLRMCKPVRAAAHVPFEPLPRLSLEHRKQNQARLSHYIGELKRVISQNPQDGGKTENLEAGQVGADQERVA